MCYPINAGIDNFTAGTGREAKLNGRRSDPSPLACCVTVVSGFLGSSSSGWNLECSRQVTAQARPLDSLAESAGLARSRCIAQTAFIARPISKAMGFIANSDTSLKRKTLGAGMRGRR